MSTSSSSSSLTAVRITNGVIIPVYDMAPGLILKAVENASSVETGATDDAGEYFAMSLAESMPAADVPDAAVILLPLATPIDGEPLDFSYLAASQHMFLRIHIRPQPRLTYAQCMAYSDGTVERLVTVGAMVKFPSATNYLVAKPVLVDLLQSTVEPEIGASRTTASSAKRVCTRPLDSGGEQADEVEHRPKGTSNIMMDLEGVIRTTRNKTDLWQRERDLYFMFRAMDASKWDYGMTSDLVLQPEAYRSMICEQAITQTDDQHPAFTACGLMSRVQSLLLFTKKEKLKLLLTGAVLVEGGNSETCLFLEDFVTKETITDRAMPCPNHNSGLVCVLKNIAVVMHILFSDAFENCLAVFVNHLEGAKRIMEVVPADFLKHSVELTFRRFFRLVRNDKATAIVGMKVANPAQCAAYLSSLFERLATELSDHPKMVKQEAYYRCSVSRNRACTVVQRSPVGKSEKPGVKFSEKIKEEKGAPSKPCAGHMGEQLGAIKLDGRPYKCIHGAGCTFRHVSIAGKTEQRLIDLVASMPIIAQKDLKKAIGLRK